MFDQSTGFRTLRIANCQAHPLSPIDYEKGILTCDIFTIVGTELTFHGSLRNTFASFFHLRAVLGMRICRSM